MFCAAFVITFGVFLNGVINDSNYVREYSESTMTYVIGMSVWFWVSLFIAYCFIWLPSLVLAKTISPEIIINNTEMIFIGGSVALDYGCLTALHSPLIFMLGNNISQNIIREEIVSITIEKAKFLKPGFGTGDQIVIRSKTAEIKTGIWLNREEKQEIVQRLNVWAGIAS
jgi:hypothetical protein